MQEPVVDGHQRRDGQRAEREIGRTTSGIDVINSKLKNRPLLQLGLRSRRIPRPTGGRGEGAVELHEASRSGRSAALCRQARATRDEAEAEPSDQSRARLHVEPIVQQSYVRAGDFGGTNVASNEVSSIRATLR